MAAIAVTPPAISYHRRFDSPAVKQYVITEVYEIAHFNYETNESGLNSVKKVVLDSLAGVLIHHPSMEIEIQGHTDCRGSTAANQRLSEARAKAVVNYLNERGVPRHRVRWRGFGEQRADIACPNCSTCSDSEHFRNRVVEFKVLKV